LNIKNGIIRIRKASATTRRSVRPNRIRIFISTKLDFLQELPSLLFIHFIHSPILFFLLINYYAQIDVVFKTIFDEMAPTVDTSSKHYRILNIQCAQSIVI